MRRLLKDYKPISGKVYMLKNDLMNLCDHEEGFEEGMKVHILTNGKYEGEDFYQIKLDVKPFREHNQSLEEPVYFDGKTWSETSFSPYKENAKPIVLFYDGEKCFDDFFEEILEVVLEEFPDMIDEEEEYKGFMLQRLSKNLKWYVIYGNRIVNHGQYRNDLKSWIDVQLGKQK